MKKYEIRTFKVETKNGINAKEKWINQIDQTTELLASYNSLEEAQKMYSTINVKCRNMGRYWLHYCKCIEENEYNEKGEWINGGDWWTYEIPNNN